jgi:hypothetical protein
MFDGTNWTWVSGSNAIDQRGVFGTIGVPSGTNIPGARYSTTGWIDGANNIWIFGGFGYDTSSVRCLNDLWKFDGTNWTWISGNSTGDQKGIYGTKGVASTSNIPGGRYEHTGWKDSSGNMLIFGGYGYDSAGGTKYNLNDLWKYIP